MLMQKTAQPNTLLIPPPPPPDPQRAAQVRQQIVDLAKRLGLGAAGVGAAWRGLLGLQEMLSDRPYLKRKALLRNVIDIPILPPEKAKREEKEAGLRDTLRSGAHTVTQPVRKAWEEVSKLPSKLPSWEDVQDKAKNWGRDAVLLYLRALAELPQAVGSRIWNALRGSHAQSWYEHPLGLPAAALALGGGAYAGWKGLDYLFDRVRKARRSEELEQLRQEYVRALQSGISKQSSAGQDQAGVPALDATLDAIYEYVAATAQAHEKTAQEDPAQRALTATLGPAAGAYLTAAALLALLIGSRQYQKVREEGADKIYAKAIQQHRLTMQHSGLLPQLIRPVPADDKKNRRSGLFAFPRLPQLPFRMTTSDRGPGSKDDGVPDAA